MSKKNRLSRQLDATPAQQTENVTMPEMTTVDGQVGEQVVATPTKPRPTYMLQAKKQEDSEWTALMEFPRKLHASRWVAQSRPLLRQLYYSVRLCQTRQIGEEMVL